MAEKCAVKGCYAYGGYCRRPGHMKKDPQDDRNGAKSTDNGKDRETPARATKANEGQNSGLPLPPRKGSGSSEGDREDGGADRKPKRKPAKKTRKKIRKVSKKQAKINREISKINKEQRKERGDICQVKSPECITSPTFTQHMKGRTGKNSTDRKSIIRCCNPCNDYIVKNPAWAKALGFEESRHEANYKRQK